MLPLGVRQWKGRSPWSRALADELHDGQPANGAVFSPVEATNPNSAQGCFQARIQFAPLKEDVRFQRILEKARSGSKNVTFREMVYLMKALGFSLARVKGSHIRSSSSSDWLIGIDCNPETRDERLPH